MSLEELPIYSLNVAHLVESVGKFVKCKELVVLGGMGWHKRTNNYTHSYVHGLIFLCLPTYNVHRHTRLTTKYYSNFGVQNTRTTLWCKGDSTLGVVFTVYSYCPTGPSCWTVWTGFGWILVVVLFEFVSRTHNMMLWTGKDVWSFALINGLLLECATWISNKELLSTG